MGIMETMETTTTTQAQTMQIGRDQVTLTEEELLIDAVREMPEWQVREFKAAPIYFQDKKYLLVAKNRGTKPFAWRYVLKPWPEGGDAGKSFFVYDAEFVAERDAAHRGGMKNEITSKALMPFYPLLGLLPSGVQTRLQGYGFVSHTITGISIFATFGIFFAHTSSAVALINGSIRSGKVAIGGLVRLFAGQDAFALGSLRVPIVWIDAAIFVALLADILMRYTYYLRDDQWYGGFLEWIFKRTPTAEKEKA